MAEPVTREAVPAMEWLFLKHKETDGTVRVPDEEGVKEAYEARGWAVTDEPDETPMDLQPKGTEPTEAFVELYHPGVDARHEFPNNPGALAGAQETGWEFLDKEPPEKAESPPQEDEKPKPAPKAKAKAKATDEKE